MGLSDEFKIDDWGKEFDYTNTQKKHVSIKNRLGLLTIFVFLLSITSVLILNFNKLEMLIKSQKPTTKVSSPIQENKIAAVNDTMGTVAKNDSYWKISKRYCGTGEFYLTIQEKNDFKPLYEGEPVTIVCR